MIPCRRRPSCDPVLDHVQRVAIEPTGTVHVEAARDERLADADLGRVVTGNPGAPVRNPNPGAPVPARHNPVSIRFTLPPRGWNASNAGAPIVNPVLAVLWGYRDTRWQWTAGGARLHWEAGDATWQWTAGSTRNQ